MLSYLPPRGGVSRHRTAQGVFLPAMESRPAWGRRAAADAGVVPAACAHRGAETKLCPQAGLPPPGILLPLPGIARSLWIINQHLMGNSLQLQVPCPHSLVFLGEHTLFEYPEFTWFQFPTPESCKTSRGMGLHPAGYAASSWPSGPVHGLQHTRSGFNLNFAPSTGRVTAASVSLAANKQALLQGRQSTPGW